MRFLFVFFLWVLVSALAGDATAQGLLEADPSAHEFNRQQERERILRAQQERTPDIQIESSESAVVVERLPINESPCFHIQSILLVGEAAEKFQSLLRAADQAIDGSPDVATGRCLGAISINLVMKRLQNVLVSQGNVTSRVLAAPQDLSSGVLTLQFLPGRVHRVRFTADTATRATQWNAVPLRPGDILNIRDIEQALENFKRVPSVETDIEITPAEHAAAHPGESDILISWRQRMPFRFNLSADDAGSRATGKYQGALSLSYDNWWTLNDLFYVSFQHDLGKGDPGPRGTQGQILHYSLPLGYWLLGFTDSRYQYWQAVTGAFDTRIYSGKSHNQEIRLSRLLYRSVNRKMTMALSGWSRASDNYIDDTEVQVQRRRMAGWEFGLSNREYLGNITLDLNASYRRGTGANGSLKAPEDAFGDGTSRPQIITLGALLTIPFALRAQSLRYTTALRGQVNETPLIQQDRFAIGSRYTVRGFDSRQLLAGERGWFIRNDLSLALGQTGSALYLGLDYGEVGGPTTKSFTGRHLSGTTLGVQGVVQNLVYDFFISQPLSAPPFFRHLSPQFGFSLNASY